MKIAIVINTSWNIYNFRGGLIKALQQEGWEVIAIAPKDDFSARIESEYGVKYIPVIMENKGTNPFKDYQLIKSFKKLYKREKPDVILHYTIKPNIYGTMAAIKLGIPVINNVSGLGTAFIRKNIVSKIAAKLYKHSFRNARRVFFQNDDDRKVFLSKKLISKEKTGLLPGSGVSLQKFQATSAKGKFNFLFIARLIYDKGILEFLQAAKSLKKEGVDADFDVLGFIDDEAKLGLTSKQVEHWQKEGFVNYLGAVDDIRDIMGNANVVVLPSYREGTPKSLLEAMAMEKPIITTDVPGCRETVKNGYNGYLCKEKSAEDLADKLKKIYALPEDELLEMGRNSRKYAIEKFDEQIVLNKYILEIKSIINGD